MFSHNESNQLNLRISADVAEWVRLEGARRKGGRRAIVEAALRRAWREQEDAGTAIIKQAPECVLSNGHDGKLLKCDRCVGRTWG